MPSRVRCFLLTPTDEVVLALRRFGRHDPDHPPVCGRRAPRYPDSEVVTFEYHDAEVVIGREVGTLDPSIDGDRTIADLPHDDLRWPKTCACGYVFAEEDHWQVYRDRLYRRSDTSELVRIGDAPAGALYDSENSEQPTRLMCKTPAGEWLIDHPQRIWSWTGSLPDITVSPSIAIGEPRRFHAVLVNGWLEIDQP